MDVEVQDAERLYLLDVAGEEPLKQRPPPRLDEPNRLVPLRLHVDDVVSRIVKLGSRCDY